MKERFTYKEMIMACLAVFAVLAVVGVSISLVAGEWKESMWQAYGITCGVIFVFAHLSLGLPKTTKDDEENYK